MAYVVKLKIYKKTIGVLKAYM